MLPPLKADYDNHAMFMDIAVGVWTGRKSLLAGSLLCTASQQTQSLPSSAAKSSDYKSFFFK